MKPLSPILLSLITALTLSVAAPMYMKSLREGTTPAGLGVCYGLTLALVSYAFVGKVDFPNGKVFLSTFLAALIMAVGFIATSNAMTNPDGRLPIILLIGATYPLFGSTIGLVFLNEAKHFNLRKLICGALLAIVGVLLVVTSRKS